MQCSLPSTKNGKTLCRHQELLMLLVSVPKRTFYFQSPSQTQCRNKVTRSNLLRNLYAQWFRGQRIDAQQQQPLQSRFAGVMRRDASTRCKCTHCCTTAALLQSQLRPFQTEAPQLPCKQLPQFPGRSCTKR